MRALSFSNPVVRALALAALLGASGCGLSGPREYIATPSASRHGLEPGSPASDLQALVDRARNGGTVRLPRGSYQLEPVAYTDPSCGNCQDPGAQVPATRGLRVTGKGVHVVGAGAEDVIIHTRGGYGILFEDCEDCSLEGVTVTDVIRDLDARATSGAVVVRNSRVRIENCTLRDNLGEPQTVRLNVTGVMGLVGREGSNIDVRACQILRHSWDGIALYREARATVRDCVIDGVDSARGDVIGGGRGVGIGVTWNATAVLERNLVTRYWKGIGVFADARVEVRDNVVEDLQTWGISIWEAGGGAPLGQVEGNVVYRTGACGIFVSRAQAIEGIGAGSVVGNTLIATGQNSTYDPDTAYCRQVAIDLSAVPGGFVEEGNLRYANREAGGAPGGSDVPGSTFELEIKPVVERLRPHPALAGSKFMRDFG